MVQERAGTIRTGEIYGSEGRHVDFNCAMSLALHTQPDFVRTLQLDPSNEPAKQEIAKVEGLLQYRAASAVKVCQSDTLLEVT